MQHDSGAPAAKQKWAGGRARSVHVPSAGRTKSRSGVFGTVIDAMVGPQLVYPCRWDGDAAELRPRVSSRCVRAENLCSLSAKPPV